jgi:hypothetical protein
MSSSKITEGKVKKETKKKINAAKKEQVQNVAQAATQTALKTLAPQKGFKKISFEEFFQVIKKLVPAIEIRPQGMLYDIIVVMYNMFAVCFPEKFEDIVIWPKGSQPFIFYNTKEVSRKKILDPNAEKILKLERHPFGSWPGYDYTNNKKKSTVSRTKAKTKAKTKVASNKEN